MAHSAALGWSTERFLDLGRTWIIRSHSIEYFHSAYAGDTLFRTNIHAAIIDLLYAGAEAEGFNVQPANVEPALLDFVAGLLHSFQRQGVSDAEIQQAATDAGLPSELVMSLRDRVGRGAGSRG